MARITLEGLSKRYAGAQGAALDHLDLDIGDGELIVLVGPSGCGKSTALRLVAGLEQLDAGRILLDGRDLGRVPPQDRDIAMVFQGYALYPHLTAREIIAFPLKMRRVARAERERKVAEVAQMLGLAALLDRQPAEMSGGEQQRVAMARAIVRSPKAFLFDEPLSNLDAKLRAELRVELAALVRRLGTTAIYVTHDQAEAMTMGDRVAVLRAGKLQQLATPREVYCQPANRFVAGFLGMPSCNLIEVSCQAGRALAPGLTIDLPGWLGDRTELVIGIRPEHLSLTTRTEAAAGTEAADGDRARGPKADTDTADGPRLVRFTATITAVEPLGAESYLHLDAHGTALRARVAGIDTPARGEQVRVAVSPQDLRFFDAQTGERVRAERAT